jgi:hypothetical protein
MKLDDEILEYEDIDWDERIKDMKIMEGSRMTLKDLRADIQRTQAKLSKAVAPLPSDFGQKEVYSLAEKYNGLLSDPVEPESELARKAIDRLEKWCSLQKGYEKN